MRTINYVYKLNVLMVKNFGNVCDDDEGLHGVQLKNFV